MLLIALRNLFQEKSRLLVSLAGVALSITLILSLFAIYQGAIVRDLRFLQESPADIFVLRKGMSNLYRGISVVPLDQLKLIEQETGVAKVIPVISLRPTIEHEVGQFSLFVTGFDPADLDQGPWEVLEGNQEIQENEILISTVLAKKLNKQIGDDIAFSDSDHAWKVAGLVPGASSFGIHYAWISAAAAQKLSIVPGSVNFGYVKISSGEDGPKLAEKLQEKYPNLSIRSKQKTLEVAKTDLDSSFLPILKVILTIAVLVGTAVIGLTMYTATVDKHREIGILKAIGLSNQQLYGIVFLQTMLTTLIGLILGFGLTLAAGWLVVNVLDLPFVLQTRSILNALILVIAMGLIASLLPVRRLVSIDPAEVFKS